MGRLHRYFQGPIDTCMQSIAAPYASQLALFVCMCGCWAAQVNKSNCVNDVVLESVGGWAALFSISHHFVTQFCHHLQSGIAVLKQTKQIGKLPSCQNVPTNSHDTHKLKRASMNVNQMEQIKIDVCTPMCSKHAHNHGALEKNMCQSVSQLAPILCLLRGFDSCYLRTNKMIQRDQSFSLYQARQYPHLSVVIYYQGLCLGTASVGQKDTASDAATNAQSVPQHCCIA